MSLESEVAALSAAVSTLTALVGTMNTTTQSAYNAAVSTAVTNAGTAGTHATTATTQAAAATLEAATATTQAGIATAQAAAAAGHAADLSAIVVSGGTVSLTASAGKIPVTGANGQLDLSWFAGIYPSLRANDIGTPGAAGFGVGICPTLPTGWTPLSGFVDASSANYGNYQYSDGSICVWVPAFYFRIGHASNATYAVHGVNSISILPLSAYPNAAAAAADSYYLHRAFTNAGMVQPGFFRDKYDCSNNGGVASSIANAMPMVSGPNLVGTPQVGFSAVGATNAYHGAIVAAKTRGTKFFPESIFIADALCRISTAHAQAATATTHCAWWDTTGVRNYPKGNDNNALKSEADVLQSGGSAVTFTSAGTTTYPNFALTGSGSSLAKTTHNGQACGIADVAGNIYKINPGMTCIATSKNITAATQANPVALTVTAHGRTTGDPVQIDSVVGMTQLNGKMYTVTVVDANTLTLDAVDGTAFTAYTSGGTVIAGTFYTLKESVDIAAVTSGTTLATDHWGATGVAAQFDAVTMAFATTYPNNTYAQRYGNGSNAVFDMSTSNGRALAMLGMPAAAGMSAAGSNAMGADYYYQYIRDQLCVISRGTWGDGSYAGSRSRHLLGPRTNAFNGVGFACASYL